MTGRKPAGYSSTQIALHWAVAALVLFQFFANGPMEDAWDAFTDGETPEAYTLRLANLHAIVGGLIFVLALWRIYLRFTRGAPPPPENEAAPLRFLASASHVALYVLIIGMPISGAAAWLLGVEPAADAHGTAATVLFFLVLLHLAGALTQFVVFRSNVLARMMIPEERGSPPPS